MMEEAAGLARCRSPPLHPQIHAREEGVGVARRHSPRLHPQIDAGDDGAGMVRRRSPRLHHQVDASEDGAGTVRCIRRRRGKSPAEPASLPDGDDILREILVRLPPQPSSLPRASAVCKRWRGLVTDPKFHRQFRAHHRKPPLLGFFKLLGTEIVFTSVMDPPDRIPSERFDIGLHGRNLDCYLLDFRHGIVLVKDRKSNDVVVCDPITSHHSRLAVPFELRRGYLRGAVLCAAGDHGHVHGGCHLSPFKVVLLSTDITNYQPLACVYSSETVEWGNLIAIEAQIVCVGHLATLIGNVLYWLLRSDRMLEFDLDRHNLAVTMGPPVTNDFLCGYHWIIQGENGAVGFGILAHPRFQMWQRNANSQAVGTWVPLKTIEMHNILGLSLQIREQMHWMGYDEDNDLIYVSVNRNVYSVQLKSMESKKLCETYPLGRILPFTSFYTPGTSIDGGSNGAEMLPST